MTETASVKLLPFPSSRYLAVIRDPESIERLPDAEREACEALWRDYRSALEELEEQLRAREQHLLTLADGRAQSIDGAEWVEVAWLLYDRNRYLGSASAAQTAFELAPELQNDMEEEHRNLAACAALLAAAGRGEDAAALTEDGRAALRQTALEWLRADLSHWRGELEEGRRLPAHGILMRWTRYSDFAAVRRDEIARSLPVAERESWRALWAEVRALLEPRDDGR